MTRQEAFEKALALSTTGKARVDECEAAYIRDDGQPGHYLYYGMSIDGVGSESKASYEECLNDLEIKLSAERARRKAELKAELERLG